MFGFRSTGQGTTATINAQPIRVLKGETLLTAALREGVDFPHSCRVGSCASCKCRLLEGQVRELTESGYLLTQEELDQQTILACQSVPLGPVRIEFSQSQALAVQSCSATVLAQEPLTHDIVRLTLQLDQALHYKPGQFALISLASLPGVTRSYSFASPPDALGRVEFFVRRVAGGCFSEHVHASSLVGQQAQVQGPMGQFWLRESQAPLLFVAGGSGLAPVMAMLRAMQAQGLARSVTLLFGARTQADLYGLDELRAMAADWAGPFQFMPVLSEAQDDASWTGMRGLVTAPLAQLVEPGTHAYLCGPPGMVDAASAQLQHLGIGKRHIHADRFVTQQDAGMSGQQTATAAPAPHWQPALPLEPAAGVWQYLKFSLFHMLGLITAASFFAGGVWSTVSLLSINMAFLVGDMVSGDDTSAPNYRHPWVLTWLLWLALPVLMLTCFASVWSVSAGDPLGVGALLSVWVGTDLLALRDATHWMHHVSTFLATGMMVGMLGTIPGHELSHRTGDPVSHRVGRWMMAFSFDPGYAIEHLYGHHRYVSTLDDPSTAPRGRSVYAHIVISSVRGNLSAWEIEAARLRRKNLRVLSWRNAYLRGVAMTALLLGAAWAMGGVWAMLFFTACGLLGKALLEVVNYMEHYGIVRDPAQPVQSRHAWNTNSRLSSWAMFNLTRHSHHHAQGEVHYQDLQAFPHAPMMLGGYVVTILVAHIPPLWHHLMTPKVKAWDRDYANAAERVLAAQANARAGWA